MMTSHERNSLDRHITGNYGEDQMRLDPEDDQRSNGHCSEHGNYNGRELKCPMCASVEPSAGQLRTAKAALDFILAGNAYFTLRSKKTGTRYTFRVARPKRARDKNEWFYYVSLLNGPDNTSNYTYAGWMKKPELKLVSGGNTHLRPGAPSVVAFQWALGNLAAGKLPETLEIFHDGKCGRCGRELTVPESVELGIGPECAGRMGL
jgi:hypothetical protein